MKPKTIEVEGITIRLEAIQDEDYISLTDIVKQQKEGDSHTIIRWLQNKDTLLFIETWERIHNPNFKLAISSNFRLKHLENRFSVTPQKYIKATDAIGIMSKSGRYGGTYAHKEIALNFCYWLSPVFQAFMYKAFTELMKREAERKNLKWHISKITDNVEEIRNLLDTIPFQEENRNRLNKGLDNKENL